MNKLKFIRKKRDIIGIIKKKREMIQQINVSIALFLFFIMGFILGFDHAQDNASYNRNFVAVIFILLIPLLIYLAYYFIILTSKIDQIEKEFEVKKD